MHMALNAKNKLGFVDGSIPRPLTVDLLSSPWSPCNNMDTSWILIDVTKDIVDSLLYFDYAVEVWHDLHEIFH